MTLCFTETSVSNKSLLLNDDKQDSRANIIYRWCVPIEACLYTWSVVCCSVSGDKKWAKILIEDENENCTNETINIVYREVFSRFEPLCNN
jgi:hypothetical protein